MRKNSLKKTALYGLFLSLAVVLSYVEYLIPLPLPAGIKIGLANIATVFLLYKDDVRGAIAVGSLRVLIINLLFGSVTGFLFGISGMLASFLVMWGIKRTNLFSAISVSAAGGVVHNIAQVILCVIITETTAVFSYLVVLIPTGLVSGFLIGLITHRLISSKQSDRN